MAQLCLSVFRCWGTRPSLRLSGYLWVAAMFGVLCALSTNRIGVFLVPPFGATLTILTLLPEAPVAQPYALIVGSVCGAAVGTAISLLGNGIGVAVLAMIAAFAVISLIHAYHPPGVALASIPVLLHTGHWFPLLVVLPFTALAVGSAAAMSKWLQGWPEYPKPLRGCMEIVGLGK
jgi:CBS-domain-containing membrane protein